jgi:subtilisin family serine protease
MKKFPLLLFFIGIGFIFSGIFQSDSVAAEENPHIDGYLQSKLLSSRENEFLDVYIVMQDRISLNEMQNLTRGLKRKERQKKVVRILKEYTSQAQNAVLSELRDAEGKGRVKSINSLWINNVIAFQAMPSVIQSLASTFTEIEKIFYDPKYLNDELQDDLGITKNNRESGLYFYGGSRAPQPGLTLINAPLVWAEGDSGQGVIVSNIDSGTDWDHPDLINNIWQNLGEDADADGKTLEWNGLSWVFDSGDINNVDDDSNGRIDDFIGWDFASNDNNPNESSGSHGTATAGVVAGDGTNGTQTGVAPRAQLMNLRYDGAGESAFWAAEQYAVENGADIITSSEYL